MSDRSHNGRSLLARFFLLSERVIAVRNVRDSAKGILGKGHIVSGKSPSKCLSLTAQSHKNHPFSGLPVLGTIESLPESRFMADLLSAVDEARLSTD